MKNACYLIMVFLIYTDLFFGVKSQSVPINVFHDFTQSCALAKFPVRITTLEDSKKQTILSLALYNCNSKWCLRRSKNIKLPDIVNAAEFDFLVSRFTAFLCTSREFLQAIVKMYFVLLAYIRMI